VTDKRTPADLLADAARAAELREHATDPAVVALAVESTRRAIERLMWIGIAIGMTFTTVSVQQWGAAGAEPYSLPWLAAWLLAPLVEVPLLAILLGEQAAARHAVKPRGWVRRARWTLLALTYLMNTWASWVAWFGGDGGFRDVLQHSVPVIAVLVGVEALTDLRGMLAEAVAAAAAARPPRKPAARPDKRERKAEQRQTVPPPPNTGKAPGVREIGVAWAVENWRDDLRPVDIGEAMMRLGHPVSKGERSRIRAAALAIVEGRREAERQQHTEDEAVNR
jgi:hypothetical protein